MTLFLSALIVIATATAVSLTVYIQRSGKLARLFLALPPETRRALIRKPSLLKLGGETRTITYLSCRIANASEIEQAFREHPAQLIHLFEKRLGALYDAVLAQGGTVERFGSAGFAAYWNAPLEEGAHALRACAAAARMMAVIREQNTLPPRRDTILPPPIKLAIGLATGRAAAGLFGGAYSVSGACVPRAEDLRTACEDYGFAALPMHKPQHSPHSVTRYSKSIVRGRAKRPHSTRCWAISLCAPAPNSARWQLFTNVLRGLRCERH